MSLKKIYNHLSGKDLKTLHRKGARQQIHVNNLKKNLSWYEKNFSKSRDYNDAIGRLQSLDKKFDREQNRLFRNRVLSTTAVGAPVGGAIVGSTSREKKASTSRLMSILRGTRQKAIKRRMGQIESKMDKAYKDPKISEEVNKNLSAHHDKLRRENLKEKSIRAGTYTGFGAIPVLGAGYSLKKEAKLRAPTKLALGITAGGGLIGAGLNLTDKDIENTPSNIAQSTAIGAGSIGSLAGIALAAKYNPAIRKKLKEMYNRS